MCLLPPVDSRGVPVKEQKFRTFTRVESTGQCWRPIWDVLEEAFPNLVLVNLLHVKALKGRKTDRLDARCG